MGIIKPEGVMGTPEFMDFWLENVSGLSTLESLSSS